MADISTAAAPALSMAAQIELHLAKMERQFDDADRGVERADVISCLQRFPLHLGVSSEFYPKAEIRCIDGVRYSVDFNRRSGARVSRVTPVTKTATTATATTATCAPHHLAPGDLVFYRDGRFGIHRVWEVSANCLGGDGQEGLVGLRSLVERPGQDEDGNRHDTAWVPECLLRDAEVFAPVRKRG